MTAALAALLRAHPLLTVHPPCNEAACQTGVLAQAVATDMSQMEHELQEWREIAATATADCPEMRSW